MVAGMHNLSADHTVFQTVFAHAAMSPLAKPLAHEQIP